MEFVPTRKVLWMLPWRERDRSSLGISTLARQETATRCNPRATGSRSGDVTDAAFVVDLPPHHLDALLNLHPCYGDELEAQCPTDSGRYMTLFEEYAEQGLSLLSG